MATQMQALKTGTRIQTLGLNASPGFPGVAPETCTIARWTALHGPEKNNICGRLGWHVVKFADGGALMMHETAFRVVDNRAA